MPYLTFEAVTSMSKKEVIETLESALTEVNWLGMPKSSKPFFGKVSKSDFEVTRVGLGRDSFNPIVYGHFWSANRRTHVDVRITFHPLVWIILAIYSVFVGGGFLSAVFNNGGSDTWSLLFMLLIPWLIAIPLFYYNASKSKRLLQERLRLIEVSKNGG